MKKNIKKTLITVFLVFIFASCSRSKEKDEYAELVKSELATGKRNDSIFFGIYLGMTGKDFFTHCWEMNKKGLFTDGRGNTAVFCKLNKNELKFNASMSFYPVIIENKITEMPVVFQYEAWAPWNKHLFADSLVAEVLNLCQRWYGNGNPFIELTGPEARKIYVKVDGNRRITIRKKNDMEVEVKYTDLLKERSMK